MESWREELYHHGILGMKWGKKNGPPYPLDNSVKSSSKKEVSDYKLKNYKKENKKKISKLTDDELKQRISRLELEKKYIDLLKDDRKKISKGHKFVADVLETAGKDIATQLAKYIIGTAVNKMSPSGNIVNPKKGQKDK